MIVTIVTHVIAAGLFVLAYQCLPDDSAAVLALLGLVVLIGGVALGVGWKY